MKLDSVRQHFRGRALTYIVLDGWGVGETSQYDAIHLAKTPTIDRLWKDYPNTRLWTHGTHVGLPSDNDLGGSEVGHMTMGAGQVLEQGPTYINRLINDGTLFQSPALEKLIQNSLEKQTPFHLLGLLSDGNIHSHVAHAVALIEYAFQVGIKQVYLHALLDGRDVGIQSALDYIEPIEDLFKKLKSQRPEIDYAFASGGGREQITMDRDQNWQVMKESWEIHVLGQCERKFPSMADAVLHYRKENKDIIDQAIPGFIIERDGQPVATMQDGHSLVFFNFRADRALQFSQVIEDDHFSHFDRTPRPNLMFASMMVYDQDNQRPKLHLVKPPVVENPLGKRVLDLGMKQFRLAETQKYPHVTFFFNGGYRDPLDPQREHYHIIDSDKLESFDLRPEMKAYEIAEKTVKLLASQEYQFGVINFANADMVGHSGNLQAAIQSAEAVDKALAQIIEEVERQKGVMVITADHGNADEMSVWNKSREIWEPSAKHSLNPVPFLLFDPLFNNDYQLKQPSQHSLNLSHVASTNMVLLGQSAPSDMNDPLFDI